MSYETNKAIRGCLLVFLELIIAMVLAVFAFLNISEHRALSALFILLCMLVAIRAETDGRKL